MRVGEERDARQARLEVATGAVQLVGERGGLEVREQRVPARVRADRDAGGGEPLELLPRGERLVPGPPRAAADLLGRDEELRPDVRVAEQRLDAVVEAVVDGDDEAPPRELGQLAGVERGQVVGCERPEPEPAQQPQLAREALGRDVEPLLAGLPVAREPVVVEGDVGAPRQAAPLGSRCDGANPSPEGRVRRPQWPREADGQAARDPALPARLEPRAGLGPGEPARVGAQRLDGQTPAQLRPVDRLRHPRPVVSRT